MYWVIDHPNVFYLFTSLRAARARLRRDFGNRREYWGGSIAKCDVSILMEQKHVCFAD